MQHEFAVSHTPQQLSLELAGTSTHSTLETGDPTNPFELLRHPQEPEVPSYEDASQHAYSESNRVVAQRVTSADKELNYMLSPYYGDPLEGYSGPIVRLFNKADALAALENAQLSDLESCARISKVIKTLVSHGEHRKLAQVEDDFHFSMRRLQDKYEQFHEVIEYVISCAAVARHRGDRVLRMSPLLLVGEPGVGKTEFVVEFSTQLKVAFKKIDLSASQSNAELAGSSSFWMNSAPSKIFLASAQGVQGECYGNPIFLLDEIDKPAQSAGFANGDPLGVLHTLLERHSAKTFIDLAIDIPIDVSNYLFFATCNNADEVPQTLRSRFREFTIAVSKDQMKRIAIGITHEMVDELPETSIVFHPTTIEALAELESPRLVRKHAFDALGRALVGGRDFVHPTDLRTGVSSKPKIGFI